MLCKFIYSCLLLSVACFACADANEEKLRQLKKNIKQLSASINQFKGEQENGYIQLYQQESELAQLAKEIFSIEKKIGVIGSELLILKQRYRKLEMLKRSQVLEVKKELQVTYSIGEKGDLKLLINQEDPYFFNKMLTYYSYIIDARSKKIQQYFSTLETIKVVQNKRRELQKKLGKRKEQLLEKQKTTQQLKTERLAVLNQLKRKISLAKSKFNVLEKDRKRLESIIKRLQQIVIDIVPQTKDKSFRQSKGSLVFPVPNGKILTRYGSPRVGSMKWKGILISASEGNSVKAIHSGRVVFSDYLRGYGLIVIIEHSNDYMSLYGYNQVLQVENGDWVNTGQKIALVGLTGGQSVPALYFEIRRAGKVLDPLQWVSSHY